MKTTRAMMLTSVLALVLSVASVDAFGRRHVRFFCPLVEPVAHPQVDTSWGTIKGRIVWGGEKIPERMPVNAEKHPDKECCLKNGPILEDTWVVNPKNKGLRDTFVWLISAQGKIPIHRDLEKISDPKVFVNQLHCQYVPHALAMREGQILVVKNSSPIAHCPRLSGSERNPGAGVLLPPSGHATEFRDLRADRIPVTLMCSIHPWMEARLMIFDHPYFAVTDENGAFEIKHAPAGEFRIVVRHSTGLWLGHSYDKANRKIVVQGGKVNDLGHVVFPPRQ